MGTQSRGVKRLDIFVLAIGLALFFVLTCYQLDLPGPHYDEAIEVLPAMQILLGQPVETFRGAGLHVGETLLPIMVMDYIGAMNTYLVIPFFAALGVNVIAMRLMPVLFAAFTLLLTYFVARELFGRRGAIIAYLTLAGSISFVFWSRQGIFVTNLTSTIMMGLLFCGLRWWRTGRRRYFYVGAFLAGLGLYTKFIFLWAILAIFGAFVLLNLDRLIRWVSTRQRTMWPASIKIGRAELIGGPAAFVLALTPLILFNFQTRGTVGTLSRNFFTSYYGVNNLAIFDNLGQRLKQFNSVLQGDHFWYLGETFANRLWMPALVGALLLVCLIAIWRRRSEGNAWRKAIFPYLVIMLIILQSCITISALWFTHFAILTPLPPLALAGGLTFIAGKVEKPRFVWPPIFILLVALVAYDLIADVGYHQILTRSGGYAAHSDASYELAHAVLEEANGPTAALDWGIQAQVQLLTQGKVAPRELFGFDSLAEPDPEFGERLRPYLNDPHSLYILHAQGEEVYRGRSVAFNEAVAAAGKHSRILRVIYQRSGQAEYVLVKVD